MEKFYEVAGQLQAAEEEIFAVIEEYNKRLQELAKKPGKQKVLIQAKVAMKYQKLRARYQLEKRKTELDENDEEEINLRFLEYLQKNDIDASLEKIEACKSQMMEAAEPVREVAKELKEEIKMVYLKHSRVLRHATNRSGLKKLSASRNRENVFRSEVVTAVFASSGVSDLENYAIRAATPRMAMFTENSIAIFGDNPFQMQIDENGCVPLNKTVSIYSLDVTQFEPVIDYSLSKDGTYVFSFGDEWIARKTSVPCLEEEQLNGIPPEVFRRKHFFYKQGDAQVRELVKEKNEEEIIELLKSDSRFVYVNRELRIPVKSQKMPKESKRKFVRKASEEEEPMIERVS